MLKTKSINKENIKIGDYCIILFADASVSGIIIGKNSSIYRTDKETHIENFITVEVGSSAVTVNEDEIISVLVAELSESLEDYISRRYELTLQEDGTISEEDIRNFIYFNWDEVQEKDKQDVIRLANSVSLIDSLYVGRILTEQSLHGVQEQLRESDKLLKNYRTALDEIDKARCKVRKDTRLKNLRNKK